MLPLSTPLPEDQRVQCYNRNADECKKISQRPLLPCRPQKSVSFSSQHDCLIDVENYSEWTVEEMQATWNTASDYTRFRKEMTNTLYLMTYKPDVVDGTCYTMRGVEGRTQQAIEIRHRRRQAAHFALLEEQGFQQERESGDCQEEWIADASVYYYQCCLESQTEAQEFAMLDAMDASRYQQHKASFCDDWISSVSRSVAGVRFSFAIPKSPFSDDIAAGNEFDDDWIADVSRTAPFFVS
jgi:hypothetical protein